MTKLHSKKITKYIITILAIMMLCNFVMPNYTYANTKTDGGGELYDPLIKLIVFLCDGIFEFLQHTFTTLDSLKNETGEYNFQYSPGIIFSGRVPALDINFISPTNSSIMSSGAVGDIKKIMAEYLDDVIREWFEHSSTSGKSAFDTASNDSNYIFYSDTFVKFGFLSSKRIKYEVFYIVKGGEIEFNCQFAKRPFLAFWADEDYTYYSTTIKINEDEVLSKLLESRTYQSIASQLRHKISTWYKALRKIALVGLLSVLLYVGIRIVTSSASPDKQSKYKKMLTDWFVAMCLLFTLHYFMAFIVEAVQQVSNFFDLSSSDYMLNTIRNKMEKALTWQAVSGYVFTYVVLCIYTVIFTIQYLKRVLYMAFYTMIAPLVTLTYPLDKIKDGKAQAFSMWLKEYMFNALLQIVHLLIYTILVSSAISLVDLYPIYALVVIGFMTQGEKIIRKMFGIDTSTSSGILKNVLAGSLVADAVKKMKGAASSKGGKSGKEDSGGSKQPRTNNNNSNEGSSNDRSGGNSGGQRGNGANTPGNSGTGAAAAASAASNGGADGSVSARAAEAFGNGGQAEGGAASSSSGGGTQGASSGNAAKPKPKRNIVGGVTALGKRYAGPAMRTVGGIAGTVVGAAVGFSAGVAQGDFSKAIGGLAGGAVAGRAVGRRIGGLPEDAYNAGKGVIRGVRGIGETFRKGAYGEEDKEENKEGE